MSTLGGTSRDSHVTEEGTEAQTGEVTYAKSQLGRGEPGLSPAYLAFSVACFAVGAGAGELAGALPVSVHQARVFSQGTEVLASQPREKAVRDLLELKGSLEPQPPAPFGAVPQISPFVLGFFAFSVVPSRSLEPFSRLD